MEMHKKLCFDYSAATLKRYWGGGIFPDLTISHPKMHVEFQVERQNNITLSASSTRLRKDPQKSTHKGTLKHLNSTGILQ